MRHGKLLRLIGATAAVGAIGFGLSSAATADETARGGGAQKGSALVRIVGKNDAKLRFKAPKTVASGSELAVINKTNPMRVGPHTLSLVKKRQLPKTRKEYKNCFNDGVCLRIAEAHEFDPQTGIVSKNPVGAGKNGWDKSFGKKGDSWYTEEQSEEFGQKVKANAGKKLYLFCAIHPNMQRKIKVVDKR